jgi:hypothetical protein
MLRRIRPKDAVDPRVASSDFSAFLKDKGATAANFTQEQREALFREFLQWQQKQRNNAQRWDAYRRQRCSATPVCIQIAGYENKKRASNDRQRQPKTVRSGTQQGSVSDEYLNGKACKSH